MTNEGMNNAKAFLEKNEPDIKVKTGIELSDRYVFSYSSKKNPGVKLLPQVAVHKSTAKITVFNPMMVNSDTYTKAVERTLVNY